MNIVKIAAFADGQHGGNPAGVVLTTAMPSANEMQKIAAEVGFSETVFAQMQGNQKEWRVRYFSPESEVPFCGHATIALGAVLAEKYGNHSYQLILNETHISVQGLGHEGQRLAALQSPATRYELLDQQQIDDTLALFGYQQSQVSTAIAPAHIHAGADHYLIALKSAADLASMSYDLNRGRTFMQAHKLVTIMLVVAETDTLFHARNAFASGGVLEDPATGAAAAAFSAYLRDVGWSTENKITIIQGADMGCRSIITTEFSSETGSSVRVSGATRKLD
ncbi:MAG: PhzF family phenazine biosynthesis protein [Arenicella sp.]|jgi:PhzF family phenazine biosynthesis protein